jgi:hypothetical protein
VKEVKIDIKRFEDDPFYDNEAYRTRESLEPWRIGVIGACFVGINADWFNRVKSQKMKLLVGTIELVACAALIAPVSIFAPIALPFMAAAAILT